MLRKKREVPPPKIAAELDENQFCPNKGTTAESEGEIKQALRRRKNTSP
jgi:hypothetical protein